MRPAVVRLIDLGLDKDFGLSMSLAQNLVQSLIVRHPGNPAAEVEFVKTRDLVTVKAALQHRAQVIHITAHGMVDTDDIAFVSEDNRTSVSLSDLAERFAEDGEGIEAPTMLVDCCKSATGRFVRAIRDCIEQPITYVGATRTVSWYECTTFTSAFYAAYFRDRGVGLSSQERGYTAAERAISGYHDLTGMSCPFTVDELVPSRQARRWLGARTSSS